MFHSCVFKDLEIANSKTEITASVGTTAVDEERDLEIYKKKALSYNNST